MVQAEDVENDCVKRVTGGRGDLLVDVPGPKGPTEKVLTYKSRLPCRTERFI